MKYARLVDNRLVDCTELSAYTPRPSWGASDQDLMDRVFEAVGGFGAFIVVPEDAQSGMEQKDDGSFGWPEPPPEDPSIDPPIDPPIDPSVDLNA